MNTDRYKIAAICSRHFQFHFFELKLIPFDSNFTGNKNLILLLEPRRQAMLQLHLRFQQFCCLLRSIYVRGLRIYMTWWRLYSCVVYYVIQCNRRKSAAEYKLDEWRCNGLFDISTKDHNIPTCRYTLECNRSCPCVLQAIFTHVPIISITWKYTRHHEDQSYWGDLDKIWIPKRELHVWLIF